jgi:hypothetical protein
MMVEWYNGYMLEQLSWQRAYEGAWGGGIIIYHAGLRNATSVGGPGYRLGCESSICRLFCCIHIDTDASLFHACRILHYPAIYTSLDYLLRTHRRADAFGSFGHIIQPDPSFLPLPNVSRPQAHKGVFLVQGMSIALGWRKKSQSRRLRLREQRLLTVLRNHTSTNVSIDMDCSQ